MSSYSDFFKDKNINAIPNRPEPIPNYYDDFDYQNCVVCGVAYSEHSIKEVVECALNEIRGDSLKK